MASAKQIGPSEGALQFRARAVEPEKCGPPRCPLCGSTDSRFAFRDNGCSLRACRHCELFFVDPYPAILQQHQRVSSGEQPDIEILDCAQRHEGERLYYQRHFDWIAQECAGAESVLDVGCGTGHLLERLGGDPRLRRVGIELNSNSAEFARRVARCEILEVPLEEFCAQHMFDAITMINVFSHVPAFDAMFQSLRRALRPGGKLILRTSEVAANASRWNQLHWGIPDDLHFLGLRTLDFICAKYGFTIARRVRTPFEDELFRPSRWRQMGRNRAVNVVKRAGVLLPGLLPAARKAYSAMLGQHFFVSFIVLTPTSSGGER